MEDTIPQFGFGLKGTATAVTERAEPHIPVMTPLEAAGLRLGAAANAILHGRNVAYVNRTFGDLYRALAQCGVSEDDVIESIDYDARLHDYIIAEWSETDGVRVRGIRKS
jgi:hypothetical protein